MRYRNRVLGLLSLPLVITYLDRVCISVAGPRIQADLHLGPVAWGWVTGIFVLAYAIFAHGQIATLVLLSLTYGGICFQQPIMFAVALDIGGAYAGAMAGCGNMAAQVGAFLASLSFGYLVARTGNYNLPFIPMAILLAVGVGFWFIVDPTEPLTPAALTVPTSGSAVPESLT